MTMRGQNLIAAIALSALLSGCVAAVIPLAAAGSIARKKAAKPKAEPQPEADKAAATATALQAAKPDAAASSEQIDGVYGPFIRFALNQATLRQTGYAVNSVALVNPVTLDQPAFMPCGDKPASVIIDLDQATARQDEPPATVPVGAEAAPLDLRGLASGLERLRTSGVSVIWMSTRPVDEQESLLDTLKGNGLVTGVGDTLYLSSDGDYRKQNRRIEAASKSCVIAMAGDHKSDFDELFDYLLQPDAAFRLDPLIDAGWFLAPAPLPPASLAAQTNEDTNALDPR